MNWEHFEVGQYVRSFDVPREVVKLVSREGDDPVKVLPYIEGWIREIGPWPGDQDMSPFPNATHLHIEVIVDHWPQDQYETEEDIPCRDWVFPMLQYPMHEEDPDGLQVMMRNLAVEVIE